MLDKNDTPNKIERLQPIGECDSAMRLHFLNTLTDIVEVQRQRAYETAIDARYDAGKLIRVCMSLLSRFYYPSFRENGGTWEPYTEFFAIFPPYIPICYGRSAGGQIALSSLLRFCAETVRNKHPAHDTPHPITTEEN